MSFKDGKSARIIIWSNLPTNLTTPSPFRRQEVNVAWVLVEVASRALGSFNLAIAHGLPSWLSGILPRMR